MFLNILQMMTKLRGSPVIIVGRVWTAPFPDVELFGCTADASLAEFFFPERVRSFLFFLSFSLADFDIFMSFLWQKTEKKSHENVIFRVVS